MSGLNPVLGPSLKGHPISQATILELKIEPLCLQPEPLPLNQKADVDAAGQEEGAQSLQLRRASAAHLVNRGVVSQLCSDPKVQK